MDGYYRDDTAYRAMKEVGGVKTDCFAYQKRSCLDSEYEVCIALDFMYCRKEKCNFYKKKGS